MKSCATLLTLAALCGLATAACLEDSLTLGAECHRRDDNDDCLGDQICVTTAYQLTVDAGYGWCLATDACLKGKQPGCACSHDPSAETFECSTGLIEDRLRTFTPQPACTNPAFDLAKPVSEANSPFLMGDALVECRAEPPTIENCTCLPPSTEQ